ncbi:hypothetical protein N8010_02565 [Crocinitomicaceae bacterium]|nr:hypothetical protein [Crocinitomicaceae bacterium]
MSKMDAPMKKGMTYCVKFNVSLSEASKYASNNIGALFLKKPKGTDAKLPIIDEPSVVHFNNDMKIMNARYNWTEVCGTFISSGGEKYIMLGNFLSDDETKYERMKKSKDVKVKELIAAYYYVDEVSVQLLDSDKGERCECAAEEAGDSYSTTIYQKVFQITEGMTVSDQIEEHRVFFAFGRDKMNSEGKGSLNFIIEQLKANPEMKLQINAHNNAMEDEVAMENDFYADMDGKRLGSVMEYLIAGGIDKGRLIPSQKGSDSPNPDVTEEDLVEDEDLALAKSRRVTFKVR